MRLVTDQLKIVGAEIVDVRHVALQAKLREWAGLARQLFAQRLDVIGVDVDVAHDDDELSWLTIGHLRDHSREKRIAGNVEWHSQT